MNIEEHHWQAVAEEQLHVAIDLYRQGISYNCALTLAGAAEEILGIELQENQRKNNALEPIIEHLANLLTEEELRVLGGEKEIRKSLNNTRNFLKHRMECASVFFDAKAESWEILQRAVDNYLTLSPITAGTIFEFKFEPDPRTG